MSCSAVFYSSSKLSHKITISHWYNCDLKHCLKGTIYQLKNNRPKLPQCLCKILSKSPLKKPRYKHTLKDAAQAKFRLIKRIYSSPRGQKSAWALA